MIRERKLRVRDAIQIEIGGREATVKKALVGIRDRFHVEVDARRGPQGAREHRRPRVQDRARRRHDRRGLQEVVPGARHLRRRGPRRCQHASWCSRSPSRSTPSPTTWLIGVNIVCRRCSSIAVVTGVAVTAMLVVRRRAPDGGYFDDGDRAVGRVRRHGDRVLRAARLPDLPGLRELRRIAEPEPRKRRSRWPSRWRRRSCSRPTSREELTGELDLLRPLGRRDGVGARWRTEPSRRHLNPWGVAMFRALEEWTRDRRSRRPPTTSGSSRPRPASWPARTGSTGRPE